jgi:hypothetical protein
LSAELEKVSIKRSECQGLSEDHAQQYQNASRLGALARSRTAAASNHAYAEVRDAENRVEALLTQLGEQRRCNTELEHELTIARGAAGDAARPPWKRADSSDENLRGKPGGWSSAALRMNHELELLQRYKAEASDTMDQMRAAVVDVQQRFRHQLEDNQRMQEQLEDAGRKTGVGMYGTSANRSLDSSGVFPSFHEAWRGNVLGPEMHRDAGPTASQSFQNGDVVSSSHHRASGPNIPERPDASRSCSSIRERPGAHRSFSNGFEGGGNEGRHLGLDPSERPDDAGFHPFSGGRCPRSRSNSPSHSTGPRASCYHRTSQNSSVHLGPDVPEHSDLPLQRTGSEFARTATPASASAAVADRRRRSVADTYAVKRRDKPGQPPVVYDGRSTRSDSDTYLSRLEPERGSTARLVSAGLSAPKRDRGGGLGRSRGSSNGVRRAGVARSPVRSSNQRRR